MQAKEEKQYHQYMTVYCAAIVITSGSEINGPRRSSSCTRDTIDLLPFPAVVHHAEQLVRLQVSLECECKSTRD